jgi:hypothetical protein
MSAIERVPPLEHGDRLTSDEFLRIWELHPEIKHAELIRGMVYLPAESVQVSNGSPMPLLENGDKLTQEEFLRRWEAAPLLKRAELLGGEVFMPSPVSPEHGEREGDVGTWLGVYRLATPGLALGHNTSLLVPSDVPQPDTYLRVLPEYGGKARAEKKVLRGAPELIVEVCAWSAAYDLNRKFEIYQSAGVVEYVTVLLFEREVRWHVREGERLVVMAPDSDGIHRSHVFPGLWLDGSALLASDIERVIAVLQDGIASPQHQAFVDELKSRKSS